MNHCAIFHIHGWQSTALGDVQNSTVVFENIWKKDVWLILSYLRSAWKQILTTFTCYTHYLIHDEIQCHKFMGTYFDDAAGTQTYDHLH